MEPLGQLPLDPGCSILFSVSGHVSIREVLGCAWEQAAFELGMIERSCKNPSYFTDGSIIGQRVGEERFEEQAKEHL